ncbi:MULTISPECIES: hypothetical protein [unclassified Streptomyces]|uniref:hypothetical protein n=1 Tax=unclassified Streptomyces TaxID=2593676 RepID=UPI0040412A9F
MTAPSPRRAVSGRVIALVLAAAVAAGVLLSMVVLPLVRDTPADGRGSDGAPRRTVAPRPRPLPATVAGERVTAVAAGNGSVVYGTEPGNVYVTSGSSGLRRLTRLTGRVARLALDPGGRWLAAVSARDELAVVDTARPSAPAVRRTIVSDSSLGGGIVPDQLAIDRTGRLVAAQTDGIGVYDLRGSGPPHWLQGTYDCSGARGLAFTGSELIATFDSCANIWNASTLRMERQVYFPGTGNALLGHDRILYGSFRHAMLLDYHHTSPLPSAEAAPGQPHPTRSGVIADKTVGTRRSPIQPVADDGRVAAVLQDARLYFWEPAAGRILAVVPLPFPAVCPSVWKPRPPADFTTSFSPDHRTLLVSGYCPPRDMDGSTEEGQRHATYRRWLLNYPSP